MKTLQEMREAVKSGNAKGCGRFRTEVCTCSKCRRAS
jgi:hypothetical protein